METEKVLQKVKFISPKNDFILQRKERKWILHVVEEDMNNRSYEMVRLSPPLHNNFGQINS